MNRLQQLLDKRADNQELTAAETDELINLLIYDRVRMLEMIWGCNKRGCDRNRLDSENLNQGGN